MKDRVASGAPLHYLSALAPRGLGAGAGAGTARGSWERAAAGLALAASAARRARRHSISSSSRDGTDGDAADEPHVSAGDVSGEGGGGAAAAADAEWDDDALAPADADYDADADAGPDDDDEDGDPERSEWALPAPPPASTPFAAASTATDAAVQETRALARPVEVLSRAGRLLARPPLPTTFADEEDMRRVLALVYDVFRYKAVLSEVLSETRFFSDNHQLRGQESRVWLLLLDLIGRRFTARAATAAGAALLEAAGLRAADDALWQRRVALAAAVARARVRCGALRMSQLLPPLLRDERERERAATHAHAYAPATPRAAASRTAAMLHQQTPRHRLTAWLNPFAIGEADPAMVLLSEAGLLLRDAAWAAERPRSRLLLERGAPHASHAGALVHAPCCLHDCACPLLVAYHGPGDASGAGAGAGAGGALAASAAVKRGALVPLERARCRGAAALVGAVRALGLAGGVAQTHLLCPRSTAYLAALLVDVPGAGPLVVFGAGDRKAEAEAQLRALGVPAERVRVWAEPWLQAPVDALEGVCCALVSPPGALAALRDPVALALARGGDVQLLEEAADAAMAAAQTRAEEEALAHAEAGGGGGGGGGSRETRPPFVTPPASPEEQRERRARTAQAHDEQRAALRMAMAQPQIQVVAFETHTLDAGESQDLVTRLVTEANTTARQKRAEMAFLIGRAHAATPGATPAHVHPHSHPHPAADERQAQTPAPAVVDPEAPPCDLFELAPLAEGLSPAADEGCFVALLRRKVVSQGGVAGAAAGPNATKASSSDASSDDAEGGGGSDAAGDAGAPGRKSAQAARKRVRALVRARVRSRRSGTSAASGASSPGRRPAPTPAPDATARPRSRAYARDVASHLAQRRNKHQQQVERIAAPTVASLQRQRGPGAEGAVGGGGSGPSAAGPGPGPGCKRSRALAEDAEARKVRSGWGAGPGSRGRSPPRRLMRLPVARLPPPHCLAVRCPALRVSPRLLRALAALRARTDLHLTLQRLALARLVA